MIIGGYLNYTIEIAPRRSQLTCWGQPKKTVRTVDGPLLCVVKKTYHLHMFLNHANLKSLKHSNARRGKAELSTRAPCSVNTKRAASHGQQDQTELSFASPCTWKNEYKSQFKRANWKRCERAKFSTSLQCSVHRGGTQRDMSQIAWTPNLALLALVPTYKKWCQNTRLG